MLSSNIGGRQEKERVPSTDYVVSVRSMYEG